MPYSFTRIEKDRSRTIAVAFSFLCLLYCSAIWGIALLIRNYSYFEALFLSKPVPFRHFSLVNNVLIITVAVTFAIVHWLFTVNGLAERIIRILKAKDPDPSDPQQKMYQNIIEEVRVATGGSSIRGMIIPTMALNACAFGDGDTVPVIAVTKGLLYKLNRNQLEGVVAHEAAHVVSGDYMGATIASSMFEIFGATLRTIRTFFEGLFSLGEEGGQRTTYGYYPVRSSGGWGSRSDGESTGAGLRMARGVHFLIFIIVIIIIMWCVNVLASLMRMFISRQRETRADAIATRLTRYPLGLAEALYIIATRRHTLVDAGDSLRTLFIVNPSLLSSDEEEGLLPELFSTHPSIKKRVGVLLSMAHRSEKDLVNVLKKLQAKEEEDMKERQKQYTTEGAPPGLWMAKNKDGAWAGPFSLQTLTSLEWVNPETMVKQVGQTAILPLLQFPLYAQMMAKERLQKKADPAYICPACSGELEQIRYEGVPILKCRECQGSLVEERHIGVILHRKEEKFDKRIQAMARTLLEEPQVNNNRLLVFQESDRRYPCCKKGQETPKKWRKCLFNRYYPIEVDKCMACGKTWFDKDELEVMQCMFEIRDMKERKNVTPQRQHIIY